MEELVSGPAAAALSPVLIVASILPESWKQLLDYDTTLYRLLLSSTQESEMATSRPWLIHKTTHTQTVLFLLCVYFSGQFHRFLFRFDTASREKEDMKGKVGGNSVAACAVIVARIRAITVKAEQTTHTVLFLYWLLPPCLFFRLRLSIRGDGNDGHQVAGRDG